MENKERYHNATSISEPSRNRTSQHIVQTAYTLVSMAHVKNALPITIETAFGQRLCARFAHAAQP